MKFEVLLYDLTSTYFESDPPFGEADKRKYGYSRDKRPDGVQVVIALVVTPEGFALAYEVMAGRLRTLAPGLTPRSMLEKFAAIQMLDVHFPTTDGRELVFARYTQPEKDHKMLLSQLGWELPPQPPPRITQKGELLKD